MTQRDRNDGRQQNRATTKTRNKKNGSLKREAPAEFPTFLAISQKV
jgi:hypothetical protein